jgi:acyl carrier protein
MVVHSGTSGTGRLTREQVLSEIKQIVGQQLAHAPEQIEETSALVEDLGADSLDVIEITMEVEEHFDITVPEEAGENARTVGEIVDGVMGLLGQEQNS